MRISFMDYALVTVYCIYDDCIRTWRFFPSSFTKEFEEIWNGVRSLGRAITALMTIFSVFLFGELDCDLSVLISLWNNLSYTYARRGRVDYVQKYNGHGLTIMGTYGWQVYDRVFYKSLRVETYGPDG